MIHISRLDLTRWGCFSERSLEFGPPDGRLQLVYGGNATGKSTTRRAITALLFGIPERTEDGHTFGYEELRIGAEVLTEAGGVELVRRKGRVNTLLGRDGQPLEEDPLEAALGGLGGDAYAGLFEISHASLVEGGEALLAGHGAVGESLFAAAAGTGRLHKLLAALEEEAAEIFKPTGRKSKLNVVLRDYAEAARRQGEATVRPREAGELRRAAERADAAIASLDERIAALAEEAGRLRRYKAVKPLLARHGQLRAELEELGSPPRLGADAAERRLAAQRRREECERLASGAERALARLREERSGRSSPQELLALGEEIRDLHGQIGAIRKAAADRRKREGELEAEAARLRELLVRVGPGIEEDSLDAYAAHERERRRLDLHLREHGAVAERLHGAERRAAEAAAASGEAAERLAALPEAGDPAALKAAVRAAIGVGRPEEEAAELRGKASLRRRDAERRRRRLDPEPPADPATLRPPAAAELERFAAIAAEHEEEAAKLRLQRERLAAEASELEGRRAEIVAGSAAPSAAELGEARRLREERWADVEAALRQPSAEGPRHGEDFHAAMLEADRLADLRVERADEAARLAELEQAEARNEAEQDALRAREEELEGRRDELAGEWVEAWGGAVAPPIGAAARWLAECEALVELVAEADGLEEAAERAEDLAGRHRVALSERLAEAGRGAPGGASLEELVALAETAAEELDADAAERAEAELALESARGAERRAVAEREEARAGMEDWDEEWRRLCGAYGLEAGTLPGEAAEVLEAIDSSLQARSRMAELRRRIDGIERDRAEYAERVAAACAAVAPELAGREPEVAVGELMGSLEAAQSAREAIEQLDERIAEQERALEEARGGGEAAAAELAAMLEAAGVGEEAELPEVERRAVRAAELEAEIPACEQQVAAAGEASFAELAEAVAELGAERLEADIEARETELAELRGQRDEAREQAFERRAELNAAESSEGAGLAAQEAQQHLAAAAELAERYAVAKLSSRLLRDAIERHRSRHQGPMLERANELFPLLTRESFVELYVDWNETDEPVLVGRAADGRSLRVGQMSLGTREQLFLALRIAAIERYVEGSGSVPVVFDDVTLESDNERAERVFAALAELAGKTQVLVFTHHRHLVEIAERVVGDGRLALHELDAEPEAPQLALAA